MGILETINSPADLRALDQAHLSRLAAEVRGFLVDQTSKTGGHLSPNLGVVAYEALNQIAHLQPPNLVIVINDNGRSYAPTVGGLARHLSQLRVDPRYERLKDEISR